MTMCAEDYCQLLQEVGLPAARINPDNSQQLLGAAFGCKVLPTRIGRLNDEFGCIRPTDEQPLRVGPLIRAHPSIKYEQTAIQGFLE